MRIYNLDNKHNGALTATIKVKVQGQSFTALLDAGSNVSLLKENVAHALGLDVQKCNDAQATFISGYEFPLKGIVCPRLHVGRRLLTDHIMYVAPELPFDVLIGFTALEKMGPILVDYKNGQLHLYTKPPKAAADIIPLGREDASEVEWKVSLSEDLIIDPRS